MQKKTKLYILPIIIAIAYTHNTIGQAGKVGINTTNPAAMLHVKDSSVVFTGPAVLPANPGSPGVAGAGTRFMWYPAKAALRAGTVSGTEWNKDSIGEYSIAFGKNPKGIGYGSISIGEFCRATGHGATAIGRSCDATFEAAIAIGSSAKSAGYGSVVLGYASEAKGHYSAALGHSNDALGEASVAIGRMATATGDNSISLGVLVNAKGWMSTAMGFGSTARGDFSATLGRFTYAKAYGSFAIGQYNDTTAVSAISWDLNDPLFMIGNGISDTQRKNAFTVLKNGNTGINTSSPSSMLHIVNGDSGGPFNSGSVMIIESNDDAYIQLSTAFNQESGILAGGHNTSIRSGIVFRPDSAIHLRSGGNVNNLIIDKMGRIGIGNVVPGFPLNFPSTTGNKISLFGNSGNHYGLGIQNFLLQIYTSASTEDIAFGYGSSSTFTERMRIKGNGNVGIGTSSPSEKLHVIGDICYTGAIAACSDVRYKKNFLPIINALTNLQSIHGMYYYWKAEEFPEKEFNTERQIGFSAQEIEKIFPEVVQTDPDGFKSVDYSRLTPILVEAIKEQQEIINKQQDQMDSLVSALNEVKQQLITMKQ